MPKKSLPSYCLHKGSGQAYVKLDGKRHYLGVHGTPESKREYARLLSQWQAEQATAPTHVAIGLLIRLYLEHCRKHYRKDGEQTTEVSAILTALRHVNRLHRKTLAADYTPKMLRAVRDSMIDAGYKRKSINKLVDRIRRMFRWGAAEGLLNVSVYQALLTLQGLQAGRCDAVEGEPVRPVPNAVVDALQSYVRPEVWGLIELQRYTGMRPGEAIIIRGCDLNTQGSEWEYRPSTHKTEHHGKERVVMIGPRGQEVLKQFLRANLEEYLFSADGDGERPYRRDTYRNAIVRGCELAFGMPDRLRRIDTYLKQQDGLNEVQRKELREKLNAEAREWRREHCWSPNRLRHNFGTEARRHAGIEAARTVLGHSSAAVTEVYAERDLELARQVVAKIG